MIGEETDVDVAPPEAARDREAAMRAAEDESHRRHLLMRALSPACIRNRACPISASFIGRSRMNPTSAGERERGRRLRRHLRTCPLPGPPPQAGEGKEARRVGGAVVHLRNQLTFD